MDAAARLREKFNKQATSDDNNKLSNTEMSTLLINPEKAKENQEKYEQDLLHKHREKFRQEVTFLFVCPFFPLPLSLPRSHYLALILSSVWKLAVEN